MEPINSCFLKENPFYSNPEDKSMIPVKINMYR